MSEQRSTFNKVLYYTVIVLSTLMIITSILSLIDDIPKWYLKILDFPRMQELILGLLLFLVFYLLTRKWNWPSYALAAGLVGSVIIHFAIISPYFISGKTVADAEGSAISEDDRVSVVISNVLMKNKDFQRTIEMVKKADPDMFLAMEVDQKWIDGLKSLEKDYPHTMIQPYDNAYGIALYSKFPLSDSEIKHLNHGRVPSVHTNVKLPSGNEFRFFGMHPVAPFPSDKYPTNIGDKMWEQEKKEVELLIVGEMVSKIDIPAMVAGDYNDVSWSETSQLFGTEWKLLDTRVGRGLYNTFNAKSFLMRWPLDHYFVTKEFSIVEFERLDKTGADHFPLYAEFAIDFKK